MSVPVDEILGYEPAEKRVRGMNGEADEAPSQMAVDPQELLKAIEAEEPAPLDEAGVRRLIANFEKKTSVNAEMRVKHAQEPTKFMNSEIELNTSIQELHALAAMPTAYELLEELGAIKTLLSLLSHDNTDIAVAVIDLIQELTSLDGDSDEEANAVEELVNVMCREQIINLLVYNLQRFDEKVSDEATGVSNALNCVENMLEIRPDDIAQQSIASGLLQWLLRRVRLKAPFDQNKSYAAEILGMLLQSSDDVRRAVGELNGIDLLLQSVAAFKKKNPESSEERELMENLFDCLCACLMFTPNRQRFLDGEGLQLMILMLRERQQSRASALKVLDYATSGAEGKANCDKFVEILGLRTIFPLFMKTPSRSKRGGNTAEQHEEHACAVVHSLLRNCNAENRQRVLNKFKEDEHSKIDRLIDLHRKYDSRVRAWEVSHKLRENPTEEELQTRLTERLEAGAFTLQLVDGILADVVVNGNQSCAKAAQRYLQLRTSIRSLRDLLTPTLQNYYEHLDDEAEEEKRRVCALMDKIDLLK